MGSPRTWRVWERVQLPPRPWLRVSGLRSLGRSTLRVQVGGAVCTLTPVSRRSTQPRTPWVPAVTVCAAHSVKTFTKMYKTTSTKRIDSLRSRWGGRENTRSQHESVEVLESLVFVVVCCSVGRTVTNGYLIVLCQYLLRRFLFFYYLSMYSLSFTSCSELSLLRHPWSALPFVFCGGASRDENVLWHDCGSLRGNDSVVRSFFLDDFKRGRTVLAILSSKKILNVFWPKSGTDLRWCCVEEKVGGRGRPSESSTGGLVSVLPRGLRTD